jgi:prevent-host-death family protein
LSGKGLISIREANRHLSRYVDDVQEGAEIIITRRGVPVTRLAGLQKSEVLTEDQEQARKQEMSCMKDKYADLKYEGIPGAKIPKDRIGRVSLQPGEHFPERLTETPERNPTNACSITEH